MSESIGPRELPGLGDLTLMDVAVDGGRVEFDVENMRFTVHLGPVTSLYASVDTRLGRAVFRGLMEGFGIMRHNVASR